MQDYQIPLIGAIVSISAVTTGAYVRYKRWRRQQCQGQGLGQPRRIYGASPRYEAPDLEAQVEAQAIQREEQIAHIGAWSEQATTSRHTLDVVHPGGALEIYPSLSMLPLSSLSSIEPFPAYEDVEEGYDGDEEEGDDNEEDEWMEVSPREHAAMTLAFDTVARSVVGLYGDTFLNTETGVAVLAIVD
ncbi:hypothetical protein LTR84_002631 [Exophiala bonariae]|uniref:Uncharacterized protein n=1 Tax=Exophiala bonariae TaxID=1690606 RepID=A0AAV9NA57_9EURO|nr:hypothetical protein LTR84_002631 [Exophiala bonariae]